MAEEEKKIADAYIDSFLPNERMVSGLIKFDSDSRPQILIEAMHAMRKDALIGHEIVDGPINNDEKQSRFNLKINFAVTPIDLLTGRCYVRIILGEKTWILRLSEHLVMSLYQRIAQDQSGGSIEASYSPIFSNELHRFFKEFNKIQIGLRPRTDLCNFMRQRGSDKSSDRHNYTLVYDALFPALREKIFNLLEVGIGTNNTDVKSNMGPDGTPGASLRAWQDYFPNAKIFGADIDDRILFEEDRIKTFQVDQTDAASIASMWQAIGDCRFDLIIDDGLHTFEANDTLLRNTIDHLNDGGYYIIEDIIINHGNIAKFKRLIEEIGLPAVLLQLPIAGNHIDNCLIVFQKMQS